MYRDALRERNEAVEKHAALLKDYLSAHAPSRAGERGNWRRLRAARRRAEILRTPLADTLMQKAKDAENEARSEL